MACSTARKASGSWAGPTAWILDTDFKLHPSIAWSHPPYVALRRLIEQHDIRASDVASVRVRNVGVSRIADHKPSGAVDAQFSLPYAIATTLLREPLTPALYDEKKVRSRRLRALMARIECVPEPQFDLDWFQGNQMRTHVEVTLTDGRVFEQATTFPRDKPRYGREGALAKLRTMSNALLSESRVAQIVATVDRLERIADMGQLARLLVEKRGK
jgi:2-methylcitrate dehydratase PrpD